MLSKEVLRKIRRIHLHARFMASDALAGDYQSSFKGQGMEFEEVREYIPGDDVRSIDWNVSARMNSVFVKKYREERELTVLLVVDVSASGFFGTEVAFKREIAAEIAAAIAYMAIQSNDKVGIILFSDRIERYVVPQKGRNHVLRVIRDVLAFRPEGKGTDLKGALEFLSRVTNRRAVVFVMSDFMTSGFERILRCAARKHDVVAVKIRDRMEGKLPDVGLLEFEDAESLESLVVDTSSRRFRKEFEDTMAAWYEHMSDLLRRSRIDEVAIDTGKPYFDPLVAFFRRRSLRRFAARVFVLFALSWFAFGGVISALAQGPGSAADGGAGSSLDNPQNFVPGGAGSIPGATEKPDIRDLKAIYPEVLPFTRIVILAALMALLLAFLFLLWRRWRRGKEKPKPAQVIDPISCHERAARALDALAIPRIGDGFLSAEREQAARFHYELSSILRSYLEEKYALNATDLTTEELWQKLQLKREIDGEGGSGSRIWIRQILQRGDEVKYAREPANEGSLDTDKGAVRDFVRRVAASEALEAARLGPKRNGSSKDDAPQAAGKKNRQPLGGGQ